ncbi:MAG TPA: GAF domain-containing protein, partial [Candidatus Limnocylindria bacterium]|nr:GAF domain-containing protein [Candidatus Limnocylindria bacterium]
MNDSSSALERKLAEFEAMRKVVIAVNQSIQDLPTVWQVILTNACDLVSARRGSLVLVDEANRTHLKIVATAGAGWTPEKLNCRLALGDGITGRVAATGIAYVCGDTRRDPHYYSLFENVRSELCVPVVGQDHILGIINIDSETEDAFTQADVELLQMFAAHAAIALQNASQLAEARIAREEWRQVFENIQDGVLVCDLNFRVQRVNKAFCRMFSVGDNPVLGQDAIEFLARNMEL